MLTFQRLIASKDFEFYRVITPDFDDVGYLIFYDTHRKTVLSDNTVLSESGMSEEEFEDYARANHIAVLFFSYFETHHEKYDSEFRQILNFVDGMLDYKPDTTYFMDVYTIDKELEFGYPNEFEKVSEFASYLVERANKEITVPKISRNSFKHLTQ
ncbi:hypothetical protein [Bacillus sp. PK3_68]|uniref:hypothetical protein n=1 Tax=Bacillus sp. PK3_68 TaxID=2027408 RepID=UPI000E763D2A|nr:hypothetical protein [Bacillus sp. PK3_68]RJS58969.1 hypothetical protein CJ483_01925 [Bacillus sp. PK3_68]